ncbi:MAG: leucyl aminopeptidase [Gemmatimonadota bacterium]
MTDIRVTTVDLSSEGVETPLLVLQVFERDRTADGYLGVLDGLYGGAINRVLGGDFSGRKDETLVLYPAEGVAPERLLLVGVGKREDYTVERLRLAVGTAVNVASRMGIGDVAISLEHVSRLSERMGEYLAALAAVEAALLASWHFRELKTSSSDERSTPLATLTLVAGSDDEARELRGAADYGTVLGRAANLARELATRPGNSATPSFLADVAGRIAEARGMKLTVLDRAAMEKEGMHALLAVARGSQEEPRFIVLEHQGGTEGAAPLVLVGKGVTFDSGGISIKPAASMEDMKYDMSGAAAVLAAMDGIGELELSANVVGIVPCTENLPSGTALKPGDVIGSHLGSTIEVINTDAEGRLILADALSYARRFEPAAILDAATLTGAVVIGLGHHAIGLMGNHGDLLSEVRAAGQRTGERCWPLPLWDEYRPQLDSDVADIKNSGGRPAGSITAGWFLKAFVEDATPWAHLDIAGTAYRAEGTSYLPKGATGAPTRLFIEWVRARAGG